MEPHTVGSPSNAPTVRWGGPNAPIVGGSVLSNGIMGFPIKGKSRGEVAYKGLDMDD